MSDSTRTLSDGVRIWQSIESYVPAAVDPEHEPAAH
jgi:hypothetical protein